VIVGQDKPSLEELAHYGVKGMHWGVRRERMQATTLSKDERRAVRKNFQRFASESAKKKYGDDALGLGRRVISKAEYDKLSTKTHVVRKGTEVTRVSRRKDETYAKDGVTYVSYKKGDKKLYRAVMPSMGLFKFGGNKRYANSYEHTFKSMETLKSPSEKERVNAFIDLMDTPSIKLRNGKTITGRDQLRRAGFRKEVRTLDRTRLGLEFYKTFAEYQYNSKDPLNSAYFEKLRQKGYNSVVDDNDRGHLADTPLILLNPNGSLKKMSVKTLTADDVNKAMADLKTEDERG
jgi:hypothetical protein